MKGTRHAYLPRLDLCNGRIELQHGAGGRLSHQLINELFVPAFADANASSSLMRYDDGVVLPALPGRLVMSSDAHVVTPLFFPGGNIGQLSINGTVNDIAMMGATPLYLSCAFILEEGLPLADLARIAASMGEAARIAGIRIVCGDTKVVELGHGDGTYIATAGIGILPIGLEISGYHAKYGDAVLLSGPIAAHGMAILSQRDGLQFTAELKSDTAALNGLVATMLASGADIHTLRDPTRGGVAATLNEITNQAGVGIELDEASIPVHPVAASACELLGIDPLAVANEGCLLAICAAHDSERLLAAMRDHPLGINSSQIGRVNDDPLQLVQLRTRFGGRRRIEWPVGEPLPRIC